MYLRQTYPNGGVIFKNAAVGEIGSTYQPPPPTPPTPVPAPTDTPQCGSSGCCSQDFASCVTWCGTTKDSCLNCNQDVHWICGDQQGCMPRYSDCTNDKTGCCDGLTCVDVNPGYSQCQYVAAPPTSPTNNPTPSPTPAPVTTPTSPPTSPPSPSPTPAPVITPTSPPEGCYSKDYKNCLPTNYDSSADTCGLVWLPEGKRTNCIALWSECSQSSDCCGESVCFGDNELASCVPPDDNPDTPAPSANATPPPTPAPVTQCIVCDDVETPWMEDNGKDCTTSPLIDTKCNKHDNWSKKKFCQLSCYLAGNGYPGDVCCTDTRARRLRKKSI